MNRKWRYIVYYLTLSLIIISINTNIAQIILDSLIGPQWSEKLIEFAKGNTRGLIVVFLLSVFLDFVKGGNDYQQKLIGKIETIEKRLETSYASNSAHMIQILEKVLLFQTGINTDKVNISTIVCPKKPIYEDVVVEYNLSDNSSDSSLYKLNYNIEFKSNISEFVIAFVASAALQDRISTMVDAVNDVIIVSHEDMLSQNANKLLSSQPSFSAIVINDYGATSKVIYNFTLIKTEDYKYYLREIPKVIYKDIILMRCIIDSSNILKFNFSCQFEMRKDDHYCFWIADRTIYLRKITFNTREFCCGSDTGFTFQPIMGNLSLEIPSNKDGIFCLDVDSWIVKGQGTWLIWRWKSEPI